MLALALIYQISIEKIKPEQCAASSHLDLDSHCRQDLISELSQFFGYSEQLRRRVAKRERESAGIPLFNPTSSYIFVLLLVDIVFPLSILLCGDKHLTRSIYGKRLAIGD
jgi:nucleotidyltransferase/DNA polymerase involved in DNA repair